MAEAVAYGPDGIVLVGQVAHGTAEAAIGAVGEASTAGVVEVVAAAGEGATELAAGAIDVLAAILCDIF